MENPTGIGEYFNGDSQWTFLVCMCVCVCGGGGGGGGVGGGGGGGGGEWANIQLVGEDSFNLP